MLDSNINCFASGHMTLPVVIGVGFCVQNPRRGLVRLTVIAVLVPSIDSTGQHSAIDAAGGLAPALLGLALTRHPPWLSAPGAAPSGGVYASATAVRRKLRATSAQDLR